jgi:hypothetical protein
LRNDAERHQDSQSVAVAFRLHEIEVAAVLLVLHLQADGLFDLSVLELDGRIALVAVAVVVGESAQCFVVSLFGYEPSGRLWDPYIMIIDK